MLTDEPCAVSESELIGPIYETPDRTVQSNDVFAVVTNKVGVFRVKAIT